MAFNGNYIGVLTTDCSVESLYINYKKNTRSMPGSMDDKPYSVFTQSTILKHPKNPKDPKNPGSITHPKS